jgi:ABC-type sugar transport system ATPase subunit
MIAVEVRNIVKTFPGVKALSDVSICIEKGEVHAIVGENGAGKSTLMKILGGVYDLDSGEVYINGEKKEIHNVFDSLKAGISVIYQELNLMPSLTVAENIFVNKLPKTKIGTLNNRELNKQAQQLIDNLNLKIKPTDTVDMLSVSQRQMVEIVKALSYSSDIIIMDEPTAALNTQEVHTLYKIIRDLKTQGKTIVYISHRLMEIFELTDTVTVLRDGCFVATKKTKELNQVQLVNLMVGRDISQLYQYAGNEPGPIVLKVEGFNRTGIFRDISFVVHAGEILGFSGLMGCGREEIVKSIYGLMRHDSGKVLLDGKEVFIHNPGDAIANKIGFVTEDRKDSGIFALMTVRENITLNILRSISRLKIINAQKEDELLERFTKSMNMKYAEATQRIMALSGGNQQKFILARALAADCRVLIMLEPTRGIDVGAKAEIYSLLSDLAREGIAIIIVSSELPEIMAICHRTLVVFQGEITGNISRDEMDENLIMQCATGNERHFVAGGEGA